MMPRIFKIYIIWGRMCGYCEKKDRTFSVIQFQDELEFIQNKAFMNKPNKKLNYF